MYVRYVIGAESDDHRTLCGVINEAAELDGLSRHDLKWLEGTFRWFNENIPVPPYSRKQWPVCAAAWFKGEPSTEIAKRIRDLVALLSCHHRYLRILRSTDPGIIHYEDDIQVIVEQFEGLKFVSDDDWVVTSVPASVPHRR